MATPTLADDDNNKTYTDYAINSTSRLPVHYNMVSVAWPQVFSEQSYAYTVTIPLSLSEGEPGYLTPPPRG